MGRDASASVFYGVVLDHDEKIADEVYEKYGIDPDDYDLFELEEVLIEQIGLQDDITVHKGGYEHGRTGFFTRRVAHAWDYGEATLNYYDLAVDIEETEALQKFCEAVGIEDQEPRWIVTADYS